MILKIESKFFNRFLWMLSSGVMILFLGFNVLTPLIADDYSYSLGVNSLIDIVIAQYHQYFNWGGRSIAHFFAQFWLLMGKPFFNIANTIVYCTFILLVQVHITGKFKRINPALFLIISIFFWYFVPAWGQNFLWLDGSCNHLWTTTIILFFLVPFRARHESQEYNMKIPFSILFFILGIMAGWSNENSGAAVLFLLIAYFAVKYVKKSKMALFEILGGIGFFIGFIFLIAAPGNYVRADGIRDMGGGHYNETFIVMLVKRFLDISVIFIKNHGFLIMAISVFFGFDLLYHQKRRFNLFTYFYALAAIASVYSMLLSPGFPDRAFLVVIVFSGITVGSVLVQYEIKIPEPIKRNMAIIIVSSLIIFSFSVLESGKNIVGIYLKWQARIEYIVSEKEKGNLDIAVKAPIPVTNRHSALYGLSDIYDDADEWPNTSVAEYFGLRSIKRLDDDEPWDSLW